MQSRIYQYAKALAWAAVAASWMAGCSSAGDTGAQSPNSAGSGGSSASAGRNFDPGGHGAILAAGSGGRAGGGASGGTAGAPDAGNAGASADGGTSAGSASVGGSVSLGGSGNHAGSAGSAGSSAGAFAGGAGAAGAPNLAGLSVYLAGDSTVSDYTLDPQDPKSQAGWGQMLSANYIAKVKVSNKAVGGRTARRFIQEGSLSAILKLIQAGDYLLVQFGTNDSNPTAKYTLDGVEYPYFADAQTDFKTYLRQYIDGALEKKAIPVLVTPPPRNSAYCNGARSLANYGQAMLELGKTANVAVLDLGLKAHAHLAAICPKPTTASQETFFKINADQSIDGTHFQENGARILAGFVADAVDEAKLGLSAYRKR